jgi:acetolactate synthase-1/2/3 large subunit
MGYEAPDFVKIAQAYGLTAFALEKKDDLEATIKMVFETPGPVVVDVKVDPEQVAFEDLELISIPPKK